jgi:hypothetical protein
MRKGFRMQFSPFFTNIVTQLPVFLVWIIGIILALAYWKRAPRPATYTLIAIAIFIVAAFLAVIINSNLLLGLHARGMPIGQLSLILGGLNIFISLIRALGWGLILAAIFTARPQPAA